MLASWLVPWVLCAHFLQPQLTAIGRAVRIRWEELAHKVLLRGAQQRLVLRHHKIAVLGQEVVGAVRHRACSGWGREAVIQAQVQTGKHRQVG